MFPEVWSCVLYSLGLLHQAIVPCSYPEQLHVNTVDRQQYLGTWYFKAAVSRKEDEIRTFRALDNTLFTMEETDKDTLLLTGDMRIGDDCVKQTWTYRIHPDREDLELEGRPQRRNLLFNGTWADCSECIIFQEVEPALNESGSEDSLNRFMLYARRSDVSSEVVRTFLENSACNMLKASVTLPQEKAFCK
ncbi:apolipoprotein M [Brachyistius frenatus]|uniref:apolipoprotein M n=1 Tax=Brachyistius frenatus TaxID=100188 RepID=UPI0037E8E84B